MSYTLIFPETPGIGGSRSSGVEVRRLKEQNLQLKEENNLLQYKVEILLDMVNVYLCYIYIFIFRFWIGGQSGYILHQSLATV